MATLPDLLKSVLLVVVAYLLKLGLAAIGIEIDDTLFNTIVAAIVAYLLSLVGYAVGNRVAPRLFR